jgi:hypothetical protein
MCPDCESAQFPHDRDYDGTDANHLPVVSDHYLSSGLKPEEDENQTQRPALTEPESETPAKQPPGHLSPPRNIMPFVTENKPFTGVAQGRT